MMKPALIDQIVEMVYLPPHSNVRRDIANRLRNAVPSLVAVLLSSDDKWKDLAAQALGEIGPAASEAVPALMQWLSHVCGHQEEDCAIEALGKIGPRAVAAVPTLVAVLHRSDRLSVLDKAAKALGEFGPGPAAVAVSTLLEVFAQGRANWLIAGQVLAAIGSPAIPALMEHAQRDDESGDATMEALGYIGPDAAAAVPVLIKSLQRGREQAAVALGCIGPAAAPAVPALIAALQRGGTRGHAISALGRIGPAAVAAVPCLIEALQRDEDRRGAAEALGGIGPAAAEAVPALMRSLRVGALLGGLEAANALGNIGPAAAEAVPALIEVLNDRGMREAVMLALQKLGPTTLMVKPPDGIERMGDEALRLKDALITFRKIGEICRQRGKEFFSFSEMERQLDEAAETMGKRMDLVSSFFRRYFRIYDEGVDLADDVDQMAKDGHRLFSRKSGQRPRICRPWGWKAWDLTVAFLKRRDEIEAAGRRIT